jgi:hypothetical protein
MAQNPNIGSLVGIWTYRSLLNDPDLATGFDKLEFGRGNIRIDDAPMGVFKGLIYDTGWSLDLNGAIGYGTPWSVRFQGTGNVGGEQWIYDYTGYVVPPWPNGVDQRPAIVGSVIRTLPHSGGGPGTIAPAGVVCSFYAVRQD